MSYRLGWSLTPVVKRLIAVNVGVFLLQAFVLDPAVLRVFGLVPQAVIRGGMLWQVVTYMFLHGGVFHLAFNMLALWMFGGDVERHMGPRRFLAYYFFTGIGAGVCTILLAHGQFSVTIGASGAIFGILLAYGMFFPNRIVLAFLLFPMRAKHFVVLFGLIELLACFSYTGDGIAHLAHLGGLAFGYLYLASEQRALGGLKARRARQREQEMRRRVERHIEADQFIREQIDPILDKIRRQGMNSLTRREREILSRARERLR